MDNYRTNGDVEEAVRWNTSRLVFQAVDGDVSEAVWRAVWRAVDLAVGAVSWRVVADAMKNVEGDPDHPGLRVFIDEVGVS